MLGSRVVRRAAIPAVIVIGLLNLGGIKFIKDAYPADPFKAGALAEMHRLGSGFRVRFLPGERGRCYARQPRVGGEYSPNALGAATSRWIDRARKSGYRRAGGLAPSAKSKGWPNGG